MFLSHVDLYIFTCSVQWSSASFALSPPDITGECEQVVYDQGVALPAGNVEGGPTILVLQSWIGAVAQQILDHGKVPASAGHHQRSPKRDLIVKRVN